MVVPQLPDDIWDYIYDIVRIMEDDEYERIEAAYLAHWEMSFQL
jgi:hypothetical protein